MRKVELLAPAGDLEKLKTAIVYGADAVYCGGMQYGLRAAAANFTLEQLQEGLEFAHQRGARVFVTVNIIAHNEDLTHLPQYIEQLYKMGVDALIIADPGVLSIAKEVAPDMEFHLSTQASNTNWRSSQFWADQGISRIVLARELTLPEIREIKERANVELEVFIHGAMCIAYSGRCLLSNYFTGRDANKGACVQSCRWHYHLVEESRPGEYFPIEEDHRGAYIMNSKDMCLIEHIPKLMSLGVNCFKIEGRMKSVHYVACVTQAYRQAIDAYLADPQGYKYNPKWLIELSKASHRPYFTGFYFGKPDESAQSYTDSSYERPYDFLGIVKGYDGKTGQALIEQRNHFALGQQLEILNPNLSNVAFTLTHMHDALTGEVLQTARHGKQLIHLKLPAPVEEYGILRRKAIK